MGKLLLTLSAISLLFLGIGSSNYPNDFMFWLSSGSQLFQIVRVILVVFLLIHIFTNPPRNPLFRWVSGMVGVLVGYWTIQATYNFGMPLMDTLAFLMASNAILLAALERNFVPAMKSGFTEQNKLHESF